MHVLFVSSDNVQSASDCIDRKWCDTVLWFDSVFGTRTDLPVVDFGCADRSIICIKSADQLYSGQRNFSKATGSIGSKRITIHYKNVHKPSFYSDVKWRLSFFLYVKSSSCYVNFLLQSFYAVMIVCKKMLCYSFSCPKDTAPDERISR